MCASCGSAGRLSRASTKEGSHVGGFAGGGGGFCQMAPSSNGIQLRRGNQAAPA